MPPRRILRYYLGLSLLFHGAIATVASMVPVPVRTAGEVMVVDLADLPRSTDFLRPRPGIVQGTKPSPPPPAPPPPEKTAKIPRETLSGRVPDLPVNPDLPPEKEFPVPRPRREEPAPPPKTADSPPAEPGEQAKAAQGEQAKAAPEPQRPPPARPPEAEAPGEIPSLRDITPSLGKMVLARKDAGAGRGQDPAPGAATGTGGKAAEKGTITEERGAGAYLTALNAPEIQYISYFAGIKRKIELVWHYPYDAAAAGIQGNLVIDFVIGRDGRLASVSLVRPSGHKILDDEAVGAIRKAAPYDPIPEKYTIPDLRIRAHFIYEMHSLRIR